MNGTVFTSYYKSPSVGMLELQVSETGVRSVSFVPNSSATPISESHALMDELMKELDLYFSRKLKQFSVPLDLASGSQFQRGVWEELQRIPYGQTRSYAEVAAAVGRPGAARAVGMANKTNSVPILIPCHRVIKADGGLGGYSSGIHIKKILLELEGVHRDFGDSAQDSAFIR